MTRTTQQNFSLIASGLASLVGLCLTQAAVAETITFLGKTTDVTDYSPTGMNVGTAGFWFAQINQSAFVTNQLVDNNHVNQFPSWVLPNFNKADTTANTGYSFCLGGSGDCYSEGGDPNWNNLKLPNGVTGRSGALVDPSSANSSSNTVPQLLLGAGTPSDFLMHIVVDNENTTNLHRDGSRVEARGAFPAPTNGTNVSNLVNPTVAGFNGTADVYTFRYTGWLPGEIIKIRLNSGVAGERGGIAGVMFDVVPEPTSMLLLVLGVIGYTSSLARRRRD